MQFTRKHSGCNDGTCPAIWDTDDPDLIGVQGAAGYTEGMPLPAGW